jgi:hypothetical protein
MVTIIPWFIIPTVSVVGVVPLSVMRIPIPIDWRGVIVCRRRVGIASRWTIICIPWAGDSAEERYTYKCGCCPYNPARATCIAWLRGGAVLSL